MEALFSCRYCGYSWVRNIYGDKLPHECCPKCGDASVDVRKFDKINPYEGSPEFPEEQEEDDSGNDGWFGF